MAVKIKQIIILACIGLAAAVVDGAVRGLKMPPEVDTRAVPRMAQKAQPVPEIDRELVEQTAPEAETGANGEDQGEKGFTVEYLRELVDSGSVILIDSRTSEEHRAGRIPDSIKIAPEDFGGAPGEALQFVIDMVTGDPNLQVVVYCGGGDCHASETVGSQLIRYGLSDDRIFVFEGGYPAWEEAGYPIEEGEPLF